MCVAVQEERQRGRDKNDNEVDSSSGLNEEMPVEKILDAELSVEPKTDTYIQTNADNSVRKQQILILTLTLTLSHMAFTHKHILNIKLKA